MKITKLSLSIREEDVIEFNRHLRSALCGRVDATVIANLAKHKIVKWNPEDANTLQAVESNKRPKPDGRVCAHRGFPLGRGRTNGFQLDSLASYTTGQA